MKADHFKRHYIGGACTALVLMLYTGVLKGGMPFIYVFYPPLVGTACAFLANHLTRRRSQR